MGCNVMCGLLVAADVLASRDLLNVDVKLHRYIHTLSGSARLYRSKSGWVAVGPATGGLGRI